MYICYFVHTPYVNIRGKAPSQSHTYIKKTSISTFSTVSFAIWGDALKLQLSSESGFVSLPIEKIRYPLGRLFGDDAL